MSRAAIHAEHLGKRYTIGHRQRSRTARDAMAGAASRLYERWRSGAKAAATDDTLWAIDDVSFEVAPGEVVGIIGRNGAGKSTLLKVLSQITEPTTGFVDVTGRIGSLLEVGTGFHQDLSGRENTYLNGAILGMTRAEIDRKFDEIIAFAEIDRFIDTPVKHYSSGMYMRLAFAVAAHLETEILVVDEVLAVGDAEFQARCLNRMSAVADAGRTVLFVSHNLAAVTALTKRAIVFQSGRVYFDGAIDEAVAHYATSLRKVKNGGNWGKGNTTSLISAMLVDAGGMPTDRYEPGTPLRLRVVLETSGVRGMALELVLRDEHNLPVGFYSTSVFNQVSLPGRPGQYECNLVLEPYWLASGEYCFDLMTGLTNVDTDHRVDNALRFFVERCSPDAIPFNFSQGKGNGALAMRLAGPIEFTELPPAGQEPKPGPG